MKTLLKNIDIFLLPKKDKFKYAPYIWLVYLAFFFIAIEYLSLSGIDIVTIVLALVLFLAVYFHAYRADRKQVRFNILVIMLIGSYLTSISTGASVFFIYASAFCFRLGKPKKALIAIMIILVWIALLSVIFSLPSYFYLPAVFFSMLIGGMNIYEGELGKQQQALLLSQQEIKYLARTAERERIARDLHDLIGHTFSVITLKAELVGKLIDKDSAKAKAEINQLENISRDALKQVREVVTGYRTSDLNTELAQAKYILESHDIRFNYEVTALNIDDTVNKELAIIVKELITNILKHADATRVQVSIQQNDEQLQLFLSDNGNGFNGFDIKANEGFGLKGIQERVKNMSGTINFSAESGAKFTIEIPSKGLVANNEMVNVTG